MDRSFDALVTAAERQPFTGWDFWWIDNRWNYPGPGWSYRELVTPVVRQSAALLDMGTGGGELLASLAPLPETTWATEAYPPNLPIARARLEPLGAQVAALESDAHLPFADESFDLVINRHEAFYAEEVSRVLRPGGRFVTQQVGGRSGLELNEMLGAAPPRHIGWSLEAAEAWLAVAELNVTHRQEERTTVRFFDIGAVVYYLRAIPWQVPEFSVDRYRARLLGIHELIEANGEFAIQAPFFYLEAVKAARP